MLALRQKNWHIIPFQNKYFNNNNATISVFCAQLVFVCKIPLCRLLMFELKKAAISEKAKYSCGKPRDVISLLLLYSNRKVSHICG